MPSNIKTHLPQINCRVIPHKEQRYDTPGDYWHENKKSVVFMISRMNSDYEFMLMIHEMIEWYLCRDRKVKIKDIEKFDLDNSKLKDPGLSKRAPYHKEHMFSLKVERMICKELKLSWRKYYLNYDKLQWMVSDKAIKTTA